MYSYLFLLTFLSMSTELFCQKLFDSNDKRLIVDTKNPHRGVLNRYIVDSVYFVTNKAQFNIDRFEIKFMKKGKLYRTIKIGGYYLTSKESTVYYKTLMKMSTNDKIIFDKIYYNNKLLDIRDSILIK